jgi:threonine/homoserine/homoserine lactone efflux protein
MLISTPFLVSSLVVIAVPGPDLLLVAQLVLADQRKRRAVGAAVGMVSAGVLQAALGLAGLAMVLRTSPVLYVVLRSAGAVILLAWGALAWRSALRGGGVGQPAGPERSARRGFLQGFLSTISNPKVGLFLIAFLPQFVPPGRFVTRDFVFLACVYLSMGFSWLLAWIHVVYRVRQFICSPRVMRLAHALLGSVFIAFGVRLLLGG